MTPPILRPAHRLRRPTSRRRGGGARVYDEGAGVLVALLFWTGVLLPYIKNGPTGVKDWMRAKFLNKDSRGRWLP